MDCSSSSPLSTSGTPPQQEAEPKGEDMVYKTKVIEFLGRSTPVILQNNNGPCPLLSICNVLSLKNSLNLSSDMPDVSQEKLLSLVAERLIDSNTKIDNKDADYVKNQQQNIADAIDLLHRLTTGIDVNIKFRRIDDFEFTPECAIFDLLDIPLYHGWIIDPQDIETADAIGSKSYNSLMGELVSLETQAMECEQNVNLAEDSIDFVAATTAALGVPSPSLSRSQSFVDSPKRAKKGDIEEEAEFLRILKLSEAEMPISAAADVVADIESPMEHEQNVNLEEDSVDFVAATTAVLGVPSPSLSRSQSFTDSPERALTGDTEEEAVFSRILKLSEAERPILAAAGVVADGENALMGKPELLIFSEIVDKHAADDIEKSVTLNSGDGDALNNAIVDKRSPVEFTQQAGCSIPTTDVEDNLQQTSQESKRSSESAVDYSGCDLQIQNENPLSLEEVRSSFSDFLDQPRNNGPVEIELTSTSDLDEQCNLTNNCIAGVSPSLLTASAYLGSSSSPVHNTSNPDVLNSSIDVSEPIYEGEEGRIESGTAVYENQEPIYEGEVVLAEQVDRGCIDDGDSKERISAVQGEVIRNFMENSASQLTIYGLFCLLDKVKERELCVFFRNNHFNTMFKYEDELYILATDQGFINQPDLVWEKLNEVNGDTMYVMGNFKDFKMVNHASNTWDEQNAIASTGDYLSSINRVVRSNSNINSDLQLAIALQQQEFEKQQPQQSLQSTVASASGLITGPQVSHNTGRYTPSSYKPESKLKDKCTIM